MWVLCRIEINIIITNFQYQYCERLFINYYLVFTMSWLKTADYNSQKRSWKISLKINNFLFSTFTPILHWENVVIFVKHSLVQTLRECESSNLFPLYSLLILPLFPPLLIIALLFSVTFFKSLDFSFPLHYHFSYIYLSSS